MPGGTPCWTQPSPACASRSARSRSRSSRRSISCRIRARRCARRPRRRSPKRSRRTCERLRWLPMCSPRTRKSPTGGAALWMWPTLDIWRIESSPKWLRRWANERAPTVLGAYGAFSPDMAAIAERFFSDNWIDAPVRPGKAPGAFSHPTVPSAHPYVLLNYQGRPRDVMTLAHELGHGVHQVLAAPNGALMAPTPLTLAETASVFGEMLTFKKLLAQTKDKKERKAMLAGKVEDMINTVVRQIAFYTFWRKVHGEGAPG